MQKPSIAVVIPTRGQFDYANDCLRSLHRTSPWVTPIVVDDASTDWPYANGLGEVYPGDTVVKRFDVQGGLTRSWNFGIAYALDAGKFDFIVATNSDVLFTANWWVSMCEILNAGKFNLVGPISNAPGVTSPLWQNIKKWLPTAIVHDDHNYNDYLACRLLELHSNKAHGAKINGFFMMAKSETWAATAHARNCVFPARIEVMPSGRRNPTPLLTGQEDWLQSKRPCNMELHSAIVPGSYIFHYRSVSRGVKFAAQDAGSFRRKVAVESC